MQRFNEEVNSITKEFQNISALVREIEARFSKTDPKLAKRIRTIQDLERRHLELRAGINDRLVKLALGLYELNKRRVLESTLNKNQDNALDQAEIDEWVAPRAKEIDLMKQEEAKVMVEINEEVEGLRKAARRIAGAEVSEKMDGLKIESDDDEY